MRFDSPEQPKPFSVNHFDNRGMMICFEDSEGDYFEVCYLLSDAMDEESGLAFILHIESICAL